MSDRARAESSRGNAAHSGGKARDGRTLRSRLAVQTAAMAAVFGAVLFLPAGTLRWPAAWIFLALMFGFTIVLGAWLLRHDPDLLAERMTGIGRSDQETWDKILLAITAVLFFAWLVLMALDAVRFRWSAMPRWLSTLGALMLLASFEVFFVTFRENSFLSPAVRIQTDRAQTVVSTGPYRYVRHPMYAGFVLFSVGTALLLGSYFGLIGAFLLIGIVARRAVLEERVLRQRLEGYDAYMSRVNYRFLPRVW
jgi:protein-S-isoprenylcysteine O-methyltransferase Ste14